MDKETVKKRLLESKPDTLPNVRLNEYEKERREKAFLEAHYYYTENHLDAERLKRLHEKGERFPGERLLMLIQREVDFFISLRDEEIESAVICLKENPDILNALADKIIALPIQPELFPEDEQQKQAGLFTSAFLEGFSPDTVVADLLFPQYEYLPTGQISRRTMEAFTAHFKNRPIKTTGGNKRLNARNQNLTYALEEDGSAYTITQTDGKTTTALKIHIPRLLSSQEKGQGKGVKKCFAFLLAQCNKQNFPPVIRFSLEELVKRGMYSSTDHARRGLKKALDVIKKIEISGELTKGKRNISQAAFSYLFPAYTIDNNYAEIFLSPNLNIEFIAPYFAAFPTFAYKLKSGNAFDLAYNIFMLIRQRTTEVKEKGSFVLKYRTLQEWLHLPISSDDIDGAKFKPTQYVKEPIKKAIEEIRNTAKETGATDIDIIPHDPKVSKGLAEWLDTGYIEIVVKGDLREMMSDLVNKREEKITAIEAARKKRIAAQAKQLENKEG